MTFKQIVDAVLRNRFDEIDRDNAKEWVNHRYAWMTALEEWQFLKAFQPVRVEAGNPVVQDVPANFGMAIGLYNTAGVPLDGIPMWDDFYNRYLGSGPGEPEAFTVYGDQVVVAPTPAGDQEEWKLAFELDPLPLLADGDEPVIPVGFHLALVHGGRSEGMKLQHDSSWRDVEQDFLASVEAMRHRYLVGMRSQPSQYPAYRP